MNHLARLVRSSLAWLQPEPGEDWGHRIALSVTTVVSLPLVLATFAALASASAAFPSVTVEIYGVKRVFGAVWVAISAVLFIPVDRITARHLAGDEPPESKWTIVKTTAASLLLFLLVYWIAGMPR
jgi:hypothetical protein